MLSIQNSHISCKPLFFPRIPLSIDHVEVLLVVTMILRSGSNCFHRSSERSKVIMHTLPCLVEFYNGGWWTESSSTSLNFWLFNLFDIFISKLWVLISRWYASIFIRKNKGNHMTWIKTSSEAKLIHWLWIIQGNLYNTINTWSSVLMIQYVSRQVFNFINYTVIFKCLLSCQFNKT